MTRIYASLLVLAIMVNVSSAFTISLVPLLTRLGHFGNYNTNQVSQKSSSSSPIVIKPTAPQSSVVKPQKFKFEYTDAHMISDYKSEIMEYVYDKALHRGFVSWARTNALARVGGNLKIKDDLEVMDKDKRKGTGEG